MAGHTARVYGVCAFTLCGEVLLATASDDRSVRILDPDTAVSLLPVPRPSCGTGSLRD